MDPTSVMGKRIGAFFIDLVLSTVVAIVVFIALKEEETFLFDPCGVDGAPTLCFYADGTVWFADGGRAAAVILISIAAWLAIHWIIPSLTGGSPGKLMVGLRVVDQATGQHAGFGKNLVRTLGWIADQAPYIFPLVGLITAIASKGHRRVGDMVAKTFVVDKNSVGIPPIVAGVTSPPQAAAYTPPPPGGAPLPGTISPPDAFTAPPTDAPPTTAPAADGISAPKWDTDRNAYIQWDPELNQWMEFDESAQQWVPISQ